MPFSSRDTIAATATAPGRGGVAIIRISGSEAFSIAERLSGRVPRAGRISFDQYRIDGRLLDEGVTLAFRGPHSYTGEDVVELQCHGGSVVPRRVLEACLASGARLARRGEFTERAFLNGRLTYEEAESVLDLVDAKTDRGADAALRGLAGERRREIRGIYDALVDLSSTAEHALDVSEEELPDGFCAALLAKAESIAARLDEAIRRACNVIYDYAARNPGVFEAMAYYNSDDGEGDSPAERLSAIVYRLCSARDVSEAQSVHVLRVFRSYVEGFALLAQHRSFSRDVPVRESFDLGVEFLIAGIHRLEDAHRAQPENGAGKPPEGSGNYE